MGRIKCLVTDLDDTLWDGKLVEVGVDGIKPYKDRIDVLRELDSKGILLSVASRNNQDIAIKALRKYGIKDLILVPQINWGPKHVSIDIIASSLIFGTDSFAFVDNEGDELVEMSTVHPEVVTLSADRYLEIPSLPRFEGGTTAESKNRRAIYQGMLRERVMMEQSPMVPMAGLETKIQVRLAEYDDLLRIQEMMEGNHKLNFSGNKYNLETLQATYNNPKKDIYVVVVKTSETDHGRAGVCIVDKSKDHWYVQDLVFSCRIIGKSVEPAALGYILEKAKSEDVDELKVLYKPTKDNRQLPLFISALDFTAENVGSTLNYRFDTSQLPPTLVNIKIENG